MTMQNMFDSANYPDAVPEALTVGDRWAWKRSDITSTYPTATYSLKFRLSLMETPFTDYSISASKISSAHVVEVSSISSALYAPGAYDWFAVVVRDADSEEITIDRGRLTVRPDLSGDTRSWVERTLMAIRATIEGSASKEQSSYSIGGRSLAMRSITELLELERDFARRFKQEQAKINAAAGRDAGASTILVRF